MSRRPFARSNRGRARAARRAAAAPIPRKHLYEFNFAPAVPLWYLSPRVNVTLNGGDIAAIGATDGNGDALAASDVAQATEAAQLQLIASDIDFAGLPSALANTGNQWIGNGDTTTTPYPICRIAICQVGGSGNAVYILGGSTTAAGVSCAIFKRGSADGGAWALYNGAVFDTGILPDPSQPAILIAYFATGAAYLRQILRDGTDETSAVGSAGGTGLRGTTWGAAINTGSGASPNLGNKFHEELTLSGAPTTEQIDAILADWATRPYWLAEPLGKTSFAEPVKVIDTEVYTAWPYSNMHYDSVRDIAWLVYTEGTAHEAIDKTLYWRELDTETDTLGAPVLVAAPEPGLGATCHSSGICPNGDYIVFARYSQTSGVDHIDVMRSTDGGQNWVNEGEVSTPEGPTIKEAHPPQGSVQGWLVLRSGRIICGYRDFAGDNECDLIYSDDNATTWTHVTLDNGGIANTEPLEPAFWQHPGPGPFEDRIIAKIRPGNNGNIIEPLFSYSDDDGETWAPFVITPGHVMYYNPACFADHKDKKILEIFMGSRQGTNPGIWRAVATYDQAAQDIWSKPEKIFTMNPVKDAGYPAAVRVGNKVYVTWYNGNDVDTDFFMAVGTAPV